MRRRQGRLREGVGLSESTPSGPALARAEGFQRAGYADPGRAALGGQRVRDLERRGWFGMPGLEGMELDWLLTPDRWAKTSSILLCALSCFRPEPADLSMPGDPHGLIAPFARANHYGAAVRMLRRVARRLAAGYGFPVREARIFSNSRLPEKALLHSAGMAFHGRNGLALSPGLGSQFVVAGVVFPVPCGETSAGCIRPDHPADPCAGCDACVRACPVGAILQDGLVDPAVCLQGRASLTAPFDAAARRAWGSRLYGCQMCQDACPWNEGLSEASGVTLGEIGPSVPLRTLLERDPEGVRALVKGTAMGRSWIPPEALIRNALVAAGNRGDPCLLPLLPRHARSVVRGVREAAEWALEACAG